MKLEHISAVLRPRSDPEAVDLGLAMVRRHASGIYRAWFTLLIPLWGGLALLFHNNPSLLFFLVWWLKPVYDRVVLFYLGRALFGTAPTLKEQLREWPRLLLRSPGLSLLWGRLSGVRSFTMPVLVLEGLKGKVFRSRTAILKSHSGSAAFGFMQLFLLLEMAVITGLIVAVRDWLPEEYLEWFAHAAQSLSEDIRPPAGLLWSLTGCYLVAVAVLEPFYAGGGFGLYINSRTHLEGWDVDLSFRQLGSRLNRRATASLTAPLAVLAFLLSPLLMSPVRAEPVDRQETARQIKEVLDHPDFTEHVEKTRTWVPDSTPSPPRPPQPDGWDWSWLDGIWNTLTGIFAGDWKEVVPRLIFAVLVAALLGWLARCLIRHWRQNRIPVRRPARDPGPRTVLGMEVTPESLPPDVPAAALSAWQGGDSAGAVRLLYRGSLAWLTCQDSVTLRDSDTEGDCLRHAGRLPDAGLRRYFTEITRAWLSSAYGKSHPPEAALRSLCRDWPFSAAAVSSVSSSPVSGFSRGPGLTLLLVMLLFLSGCRGHWEDRERETGYQGQAKRNPFLAATRFLEANGIPVLVRRGVTDLPDNHSVLLAPAESIGSRAAARQVLDWVRQGGHLIYLAEGAESWINDWSGASGHSSLRLEAHPFPALLGITLNRTAPPSKADRVDIDGESYAVSLADSIHFDLSEMNPGTGLARNPDILTGPETSASLASFPILNGRVTLVSSAHLFRNRWIDDDDHAALLLALIDATGPVNSVVMVKTGRTSLWTMLRDHAWRALVAAALLLAFWLWRVLPRFGPVIALRPGREHRFAHHLREAGAFLWRHRLTDALVEAPRQAVLAAARRAALTEHQPGFVNLLAARAGLPPERVQDALYGGTLHDPKILTRQIADLQTLHSTLSHP